MLRVGVFQLDEPNRRHPNGSQQEDGDRGKQDGWFGDPIQTATKCV
jgi:hypothetical protein